MLSCLRLLQLLASCTLLLLALPSVTASTKIIIERASSDEVLWRKCGNITEGPVPLNDACIELSKTSSCELRVVATVGNARVLNNTLDFSVAPITCGQYSFCNVCVSIPPNSRAAKQHCVNVVPECAGQTVTSYEVGCFNNTVLDPILNCVQAECPAGCSGHGVCDRNTGTCLCSNGYYGADCSSQKPYFEQCLRVDRLSGDVCVRLTYKQCEVDLTSVLVTNIGEVPVYQAEYPLKQFAKFFAPNANALCYEAGGVCTACINFGNLQISDSIVRGCGNLSLTCMGMDYGTKSLGCFSDNQVTPACFACDNNCNNRGVCDRGTCTCSAGYTGDDCSLLTCPKGCSGHGNCDYNTGKCLCDSHWKSSDCSVYSKSSSDDSSQSNPGKGAYVGGIVAAVVGVALFVSAVVYFIRKRMQRNQPVFHQLDLIQEEDHEGLVDDE